MLVRRDECMTCGHKLSHIKALHEIAYFAELLIDSVVRYDDGEVIICSSYLELLKEKLEAIE